MTIPRDTTVKSLKKRPYKFSVYVSQDFRRCPPNNKYFRIVAHIPEHTNHLIRFASVRPTATQYFQYLTRDHTYMYFSGRCVFPEFILSHVSWKELVVFFQTEALLEAL